MESENEESRLEIESENEGSEEECLTTVKKVRRRKPGIIYLSTIPSSMNVLKIREYFSRYGQLGKVFLQPIKDKAGKKGKRFQFSEGWIEYKSKRKAKYVAGLLNNQQVGGKKRNPDYDTLWNIKYLPRFKWEFLSKRLEYESEMFRKRMGAEVSQVNKETDHYLRATLASEKMKKKKKKGEEPTSAFVYRQKKTEDEIQKKGKKEKDEYFKKIIQKNKLRKKKLKGNKTTKDDFLTSIFVGADK
ncbi:UNVERIFIED_CONTAM: hypothetical protein GTU68_028516 [Idotea baltica]|nr:hypothetical protein [Idotea baltica]